MNVKEEKEMRRTCTEVMGYLKTKDTESVEAYKHMLSNASLGQRLHIAYLMIKLITYPVSASSLIDFFTKILGYTTLIPDRVNMM